MAGAIFGSADRESEFRCRNQHLGQAGNQNIAAEQHCISLKSSTSFSWLFPVCCLQPSLSMADSQSQLTR